MLANSPHNNLSSELSAGWHDLEIEAVVIRTVASDHLGQVIVATTLRGQCLIDMPGDERLPRIGKFVV